MTNQAMMFVCKLKSGDFAGSVSLLFEMPGQLMAPTVCKGCDPHEKSLFAPRQLTAANCLQSYTGG
ncbi:MAG: hypothetical protein CVV27_06210, partial [Candidatus Melainabacteria bacterium HGW-Melainabacteria-1]